MTKHSFAHPLRGMLVSAKRIAEQHDVIEETVREWHAKGWIPGEPYGRQTRYDPAAVDAALSARRQRSVHGKLCSACGRDLPLDAFNLVKDKRKGHEGEKVPASDCRECRKRQRREWRAGKAEEAGRQYMTREEMAAEREARERQAQEDKARRAAERAAERALRPRLSKEEKTRRATSRKRERRRTDPEYQARIKARNIRRSRAQKGTQVIPINRERVAKRDGWMCGICGKIVTRANWSLDHIIPLSRGGSHTYQNVTLAHRLCNIRRNTGRLPVQAPLFPFM